MFQHTIDPREIFSHIFGQRNQSFQQQQIFRTNVNVSLEDAYYGKSQVLQLHTPMGPKVINIDIPKGIKENSHIKYENILDGASLLVEFKILPHLKFERRGNDLYCNQPISVLDLITGTKIIVTTISNTNIEVNVPPKTQPNMQLKINGYGMPIQGTNVHGDQIILLKPFVPDIISNEIIEVINRSKSSQ
jgi:DnaJ-class molecular chaperone